MSRQCERYSIFNLIILFFVLIPSLSHSSGRGRERRITSKYHKADSEFATLPKSAQRNINSTVFIQGSVMHGEPSQNMFGLGAGTGFFVAKDKKNAGYILTNHHVAESLNSIKILHNHLQIGKEGQKQLLDGQLEFEGGHELDYAIIKIDGVDALPHLDIVRLGARDKNSSYIASYTSNLYSQIRSTQGTQEVQEHLEGVVNQLQQKEFMESFFGKLQTEKPSIESKMEEEASFALRTIQSDGQLREKFEEMFRPRPNKEVAMFNRAERVMRSMFSSEMLDKLSVDFLKELSLLNTENDLHLDHTLVPGQSGAPVANWADGNVFGIAGRRDFRPLHIDQSIRANNDSDSILNWTIATSTVKMIADMKLKLEDPNLASNSREAIRAVLDHQNDI